MRAGALARGREWSGTSGNCRELPGTCATSTAAQVPAYWWHETCSFGDFTVGIGGVTYEVRTAAMHRVRSLHAAECCASLPARRCLHVACLRFVPVHARTACCMLPVARCMLHVARNRLRVALRGAGQGADDPAQYAPCDAENEFTEGDIRKCVRVCVCCKCAQLAARVRGSMRAASRLLARMGHPGFACDGRSFVSGVGVVCLLVRCCIRAAQDMGGASRRRGGHAEPSEAAGRGRSMSE